MVGFISLPEEVIELVGEHVIRGHGLKAWCRATSTCKRLWGMPLPGSTYRWCLKANIHMRGESKACT